MCRVNDKDNPGNTHQNENNTQANDQQPLQQQVSFDDNGFILTEQERIAAEIERMERSRRTMATDADLIAEQVVVDASRMLRRLLTDNYMNVIVAVLHSIQESEQEGTDLPEEETDERFDDESLFNAIDFGAIDAEIRRLSNERDTPQQ